MATSVNYAYSSRDWRVSSGDKPTWLRAKIINGTATAQDDKWVFNVDAGFESDYGLSFTSADESNKRVYMRLTIKEGDTVLATKTQLLTGQYYCSSLAADTKISLSTTSSTTSATTVSVELDFDFYTDFIGTNGSKGLYWQSKGTNIYNLYEYGSFSVGDLYQKPSFNEVRISDRTTKSITIYSSWNDIQNKGGAYKDADTYVNLYDANGNELSDGNGNKQLIIYGSAGDPSGTVTFDNLPTGKNYKIKAYLTDGTTTIWYNDGNFIDTSTKKLSLVKESISVYQFNIISKWHSEIDDTADTTGISFYSYNCKDNNTKNECGTTSYSTTSSPNRTVTTVDLESYTDYLISYKITDGFNIVAIEEVVQTIFPYARVYVDNEWHKVIPYIYYKNSDNTYSWHKAKGHIYNDPDNQNVTYTNNTCYTKYNYQGYDDNAYTTYFYTDSESDINVENSESTTIVNNVNSTASSNLPPEYIIQIFDQDDYLIFEYSCNAQYSREYYTIYRTSDGRYYYGIENAIEMYSSPGDINTAAYIIFDPDINKICYFSNVDTTDYSIKIWNGKTLDRCFKEFSGI